MSWATSRPEVIRLISRLPVINSLSVEVIAATVTHLFDVCVHVLGVYRTGTLEGSAMCICGVQGDMAS